ncbi:hypothetical protein D3C80_2087320 [compost metagenome]
MGFVVLGQTVVNGVGDSRPRPAAGYTSHLAGQEQHRMANLQKSIGDHTASRCPVSVQ